jgi:hypothetical protein
LIEDCIGKDINPVICFFENRNIWNREIESNRTLFYFIILTKDYHFLESYPIM